jgi:hypothetical protein
MPKDEFLLPLFGEAFLLPYFEYKRIASGTSLV